MTELVECNTQLHKTLQGLWSDALTQHKLQQQHAPYCIMVALKYGYWKQLPETNIEDTVEILESFDWVFKTVNEMIRFSC